MALSARYPLLNPKFDDFLFASIGRQENDMPLSVASALARLGADPWVEAERLARLPRQLATEALVSMILKSSPARVEPADAPTIAARIMLLLPSGVEVPPTLRSGPAAPARGRLIKALLLLSLIYVAFAALNLLTDLRQAPEAPIITEETPTS